jgi:hypothetical protein
MSANEYDDDQPDLEDVVERLRAENEQLREEVLVLTERAAICYSGQDVANAAEAMRAKCEAIARREARLRPADRIAALPSRLKTAGPF